MNKSQLKISCSDGYQLSATLFESATPKGVVVIASAIGIKQSYYERFACFLSENSYHAITFDYRGRGKSRNKHKETFPTFELSDWGAKDIEAVIEHAKEYKQPISFIGHSIGGQILGLAKSSSKLSKIIFVASSSPYWRRWKFPENLKILMTSRVVFPVVTAIKKEFPSKVFGLGNKNISSGYINQWAKWMSKPDYLFEKEFNLNTQGYKLIKVEILSLGFEDDKLAPEVNIKHLLSHYPNASSELNMIAPNDAYTSAIGHTGFFRDKFKLNLWINALAWLDKKQGSS